MVHSSDEQGVPAGAPDPPGGHARRRLDEELTSRFGPSREAEPPAHTDDEPSGADDVEAGEPPAELDPDDADP